MNDILPPKGLPILFSSVDLMTFLAGVKSFRKGGPPGLAKEPREVTLENGKLILFFCVCAACVVSFSLLKFLKSLSLSFASAAH